MDLYILILIAVILILVSTAFTYKQWKSSIEIPGLKPRSKLEGNMADIGEAGSLHQFLLKLHRRFGPISSFWFGSDYVVSTASPEIFKEQQNLFNRPGCVFKMFEPILGKNSIQYANYEEGQYRRKVCDRAYSADAMKDYYDCIQMATDEMVQNWAEHKNESIPLMYSTLALAIKANSMVTLGTDLDEGTISEVWRIYLNTWKETEDLLLIGPPQAGSDRERNFNNSVKNLREIILKICRENREQNSSNDIPGNHLIDCLVRETLSDDVIASDTISFMMGGFHSTGFTMTWAFYYLATNQDVQDKAAEEIKTNLGNEKVDHVNVNSLVYVKQVINETLRLAIVGTIAGRFSDNDITLGGYTISKGTPIIQALGVIGQDEKYWPNPERFDPDRFSSENSKNYPQMAFQPFGFAGKRKCPGYRLTYTEITVVIASVLRHFRVKLVPGQHVKMLYAIIARPEQEIWIKVEKRE